MRQPWENFEISLQSKESCGKLEAISVDTISTSKERRNMNDFLSFSLTEDFVAGYADRQPNWGFSIGGGNYLSELVYVNKYSALKEDGTKEQWYETCQRCIEGMYSILKDHCKKNKTTWNDLKAQKSARDAYDRMWNFKWMPPGRGLQHMGREAIHTRQDSSFLQNCAYLTTAKLSAHSAWEATGPFSRMMEMSMCGIGVGFDTRGAGNLSLHEPSLEKKEVHSVEDSREGWADAITVLLESYFFKNRGYVDFDYSPIRPAGAMLKSFGGRASGPQPLIDCVERIRFLLDNREDDKLNSRDIVDIMNLIGKAVVAGGARRSAQIAFGETTDMDYVSIKDWNLPENKLRTDPDVGWAWNSNNSVFVDGEISSDLIEKTILNGEPGYMWLDLAQQYGRMVDPADNKDYRAMGGNPCLEQTLEPWECCTLVETFPSKHEDFNDFRETLKHAYLYGKAVTLLPTAWPETNEVMARNRRIGCSMSGLAEFVETKGWSALQSWQDEGYQFIDHRDKKYSEWLAVRESIKKTSIKPSGTVSLVASVTAGVHWPVSAGNHIRRVRYSVNDPLVSRLIDAGYPCEPMEGDPENTVVVTFVTQSADVRSEREVSIWEKAELAVMSQRWWADNQVSATITFLPSEENQIAPLLASKTGQIKGISFLPLRDEAVYAQAPYEAIDVKAAEKFVKKIKHLNNLYAVGSEAIGDKFCDSDVCTI